MNFDSLSRGATARWRRTACLLVLLLVAGCGREEIRVYVAPKDKAPPEAPPMAVRPRPVARPQAEWTTLPTGWQKTKSDEWSVASFTITSENGETADVRITPMPLMAGRESMIVNMWREQVGMEPLGEEEAMKQFQPIEVGGEKGSLFEISGRAEGGPATRVVTGMVHLSDASLFFKLQGSAALVETQKLAFLEFLKSIRIKAAPQPAPGGTGETTKFNWQVPKQWKALPAGEMQVARFALPERGAAKAEVFVSVFANDTGGTLANVNRWRQELGLREVDDAGLPQVVTSLDPADPATKLVDFTNNNRRLVAAIVPREGQYWFYKLRGDAEAVSPERDAFVAFVKSTP